MFERLRKLLRYMLPLALLAALLLSPGAASEGCRTALSVCARLIIPYQIFGTDFRSTGKTIEIEFTVRDVREATQNRAIPRTIPNPTDRKAIFRTYSIT